MCFLMGKCVLGCVLGVFRCVLEVLDVFSEGIRCVRVCFEVLSVFLKSKCVLGCVLGV